MFTVEVSAEFKKIKGKFLSKNKGKKSASFSKTIHMPFVPPVGTLIVCKFKVELGFVEGFVLKVEKVMWREFDGETYKLDCAGTIQDNVFRTQREQLFKRLLADDSWRGDMIPKDQYKRFLDEYV